MNEFDEYQERAAETAQYQHKFYPFASLMIESAELSDLVAKQDLRGDNKQADRDELISEAGDVLWNLAMCCRQYGVDLSTVARCNLAKLASRADRGVIKGDGGKR